MSNQIHEKIQLVKDELRGKNTKINTRKKEFESLIDIQKKEVEKILLEMKPIIDHIKGKELTFKNKKLNLGSIDGPVVGVDVGLEEMYVLSSNGNINGFNMYSKELTTPNIKLDNFLSDHPLDTLLESLFETLEIQDRVLEYYQNKIEEAKTTIKKYNISL